MTAIQIIPYQPVDVEALYQIFATATPQRQDAEASGFLLSQYTVDGFGDFLATRQSYIAYHAAVAVGFVVIAPPTRDQMDPIEWIGTPPRDEGDGCLCWIKMVAVLPSHKRHGVATSLYHHLFDTHPHVAFITGLYETPLNNRASAQFHLALGFQRVGVIARSNISPTGKHAHRVTGIYYRRSNA